MPFTFHYAAPPSMLGRAAYQVGGMQGEIARQERQLAYEQQQTENRLKQQQMAMEAQQRQQDAMLRAQQVQQREMESRRHFASQIQDRFAQQIGLQQQLQSREQMQARQFIAELEQQRMAGLADGTLTMPPAARHRLDELSEKEVKNVMALARGDYGQDTFQQIHERIAGERRGLMNTVVPVPPSAKPRTITFKGQELAANQTVEDPELGWLWVRESRDGLQLEQLDTSKMPGEIRKQQEFELEKQRQAKQADAAAKTIEREVKARDAKIKLREDAIKAYNAERKAFSDAMLARQKFRIAQAEAMRKAMDVDPSLKVSDPRYGRPSKPRFNLADEEDRRRMEQELSSMMEVYNQIAPAPPPPSPKDVFIENYEREFAVPDEAVAPQDEAAAPQAEFSTVTGSTYGDRARLRDYEQELAGGRQQSAPSPQPQGPEARTPVPRSQVKMVDPNSNRGTVYRDSDGKYYIFYPSGPVEVQERPPGSGRWLPVQ